MSSPLDTIRTLYDAFGRGDVPTVLDTLHDRVDWKEAEGGPLAVGNPYVGPQAVAEGVFGPLVSDIDDFTVTPERFVVGDGEVVAMGRYTGVHRASGRQLDAQFAHHWSVADGKVVAFQQYTDTRQWTELFADD